MVLYTSAWALAPEPPGPCTRDPGTQLCPPVGKHNAQGSMGLGPPTKEPTPALGHPGPCSQRPQDLATPTSGPARVIGPSFITSGQVPATGSPDSQPHTPAGRHHFQDHHSTAACHVSTQSTYLQASTSPGTP